MRLQDWMRRLRLMFGVLCVASVLSFAGATAPANMNCTEGDPRLAYGAFLGLIHFGLDTGVEPLCVANDDAGRSAIKTYRGLAVAISHLRDAERTRFGDSDALDPRISLPINPGNRHEIINGNRAVLHGHGERDIPMVQINGTWRLDVTALIRTGGFTREDQSRLEQETARIDRLTRFISSGGPM
jgi:hypothetical protein